MSSLNHPKGLPICLPPLCSPPLFLPSVALAGPSLPKEQALNPQTLLQDLMADLKSELSGSLAKLILGLMLTPAQYDAKQLRKAVEVTATLVGSASACEDKAFFTVVVPTLVVAWGCECTPASHPPKLLYMEGKQSRKHQDKDLACTQDLPGAQFGLSAAQHALTSSYTKPSKEALQSIPTLQQEQCPARRRQAQESQGGGKPVACSTIHQSHQLGPH